MVIEQILIGIAAVIFSILLNSLVEWFVHGPMMHGKLSKFFGMEKNHREHHEKFGGSDLYENDHHGTSVALPLWAFFILMGFMALFGWFFGYIFGYSLLFFYVLVVSIIYYSFYQYIHTSMHIPKGRWIETTRWFTRKNSYHKAHHLVDRDYAELINICVVCSWADKILGTTAARKMKKVS